MERKLTAVVLTSIVLLSTFSAASAAILSTGAGNHGAGNEGMAAGNQATVTVTSTGSASAQADSAVLDVTVTAEGPNASAAANRLADDVSALRDALDDENLSVTSVRTTGYSVSEADNRSDRGEGRGPPDETTYVATQTLAVTTNDTESVGAVSVTALSNGASSVDGVSFALSDERRRTLRSEAVDEALADAEFQAESVAETKNLTLGQVQSVTVGDGSGVETSGTNPVTVHAEVTVTYNATAD